MPACRPPHLRPALVSAGPHNDKNRLLAPIRTLARGTQHTSRRTASSAAAVARKPTDGETYLNPVRTTLHKATTFLPRVLSPGQISTGPRSLEFWEDILDESYHKLNGATAEAARVAVYGYDKDSEARTFVTALLEEPFAPDTRKQAIRDRWKDKVSRSGVVISHGYAPSDDPARLRTPSSWLQQFSVPLEIHEVPVGTPGKDLYAADIPVILCSPLTTSLKDLSADDSMPLNHGNAILVIISSSEVPEDLKDRISRLFPSTLSIVFADPQRALAAIQTLSSQPGSSVAVQRYQDNFTASGVSAFTSVLAEKLAVTSGSVATMHSITAQEQVKAALSSCGIASFNALEDTIRANEKALMLQQRVAQLKERIGPEVLGVDSRSSVRESVGRAKRDVKVVMDRLTWWRCVWRVDDVGETVYTAVRKAWCRDLEDTLIFHSGRLASAQEDLKQASMDILHSYTYPSPFHSAVLNNQLAQIQASPNYAMTPAALTSPIHARLAQFTYPTNMLHATAQRVTLGMGGSVLGGLGTIGVGWAEHLGVLQGVLGMQMETALATGLFVATSGVWWMVRQWEKAKRRWWKDWDRVGEGLERDLQTSLQRAVEDKVTIIPTQASDGLRRLAEARQEEVRALEKELIELQREADNLLRKYT